MHLGSQQEKSLETQTLQEEDPGERHIGDCLHPYLWKSEEWFPGLSRSAVTPVRQAAWGAGHRVSVQGLVIGLFHG